MARKYARERARYSDEIGGARGELYKKALGRANDAFTHGYFLETIALTESLMADRFEALISLMDGRPAKFGTVSEAVRELQQRLASAQGAQGLELFTRVKIWSTDRSRWIHEFAKLPADGNLDWGERLEEAGRVASDGLDLLKEVTAEVTSAMREIMKQY